MVLAPPSVTDVLLRAYGLLRGLYTEVAAAQQGGLWVPGGMVTANTTVACPGVPMAMVVEAKYALSVLPPAQATDVVVRALGWLGFPHAGLRMWEGVRGRAYRSEEQLILHDDAAALLETPCPFLHQGQCLLGDARPLACRAAGLDVRPGSAQGKRLIKAKGRLTRYIRRWVPGLNLTCWLPTLLAREVAREEVVALHREGKVADIKLALSTEPIYLFKAEEEQ